MRKGLGIACAIVIVAMVAAPRLASAHCQIPCGIYDDHMRIDMLNENIATIEKAISSMADLSAAADKNYNQIVRWVTNKDDHAQQFMDIVTDYFMAQRIKPTDSTDVPAHADYVKKLETLHNMLVVAMKCKQSTDVANVEKLKKLVADFEALYFKGIDPEGQHKH